jgi:hypothetical protein
MIECVIVYSQRMDPLGAFLMCSTTVFPLSATSARHHPLVQEKRKPFQRMIDGDAHRRSGFSPLARNEILAASQRMERFFCKHSTYFPMFAHPPL